MGFPALGLVEDSLHEEATAGVWTQAEGKDWCPSFYVP